MTATPARSVRFVRNAGWNILSQAALAVMSFLLIPYLMKSLGKEGYALYALMGVLSSYLMLLSLGTGSGILKFVSEHPATGNTRELRTVLGLSLWLHVFVVAAVSALAMVFGDVLVNSVFTVPLDRREEAMTMFGCALASTAFLGLSQYGLSTLQGLQRFDLSSAISFAQPSLLLAGSCLIIRWGGPLKSLGWYYLAVQILLGLSAFALTLKFLPVKPAWLFWERSRFSDWDRFLRFSLGAFVAQLAWSVIFQWDRVFIGHWLPLSELTYYIIPSFILQKFWIIPNTICNVTFPMFSELHGMKDAQAMKIMYKKSTQLLLWAALPAFVLLTVLAPQLLTLWLGEEFSTRGTWPLRILALGYLFHFLVVVSGAAYSGSGYIREALLTNAALSGLSLLFWWILIPRMGIMGASWGFFLALAFSSAPFIRHVNRRLFNLSTAGYIKEICAAPLAAAAVLGLTLWLCRHALYTWTSLLAGSTAVMVLYLGIVYHLLDDDSRETLTHLIDVFLKKSSQREISPT